MEPIEAFPLQWPVGWKRSTRPAQSQFKNDKTVEKSCQEVISQLKKMNAGSIVISTNIPLRKDGLPYSSYKSPDDKGAAVYFNLKNTPHVLACDKWDKLEHNLWAIAKHIEALRGQDRWGVGNLEQAFAGFKALPERTLQVPWWNILGVNVYATEKEIESRYRILAKIFHPDVPGGDSEAMQTINLAKKEGLNSIKK